MLLGKGRYGAGLNRVSLSFRNRKEIKVRRRAGAAPQATRGKPSLQIFSVAHYQAHQIFGGPDLYPPPPCSRYFMTGPLDNQFAFRKLHNTQTSIMNITETWFRNINEQKTNLSVCGIPQGSCLGPLLFIIYMNDFEKCLKKSKPNMYVDDTSISYASNEINELFNEIKGELDLVSSWMRQNKLSLNAEKSEFMLIGHPKQLNKAKDFPDLEVEDQKLCRAQKTKYLGVIIDESMNWEEQLKTVKRKIKNGLGAMFNLKNILSQKQLATVYRALIGTSFGNRSLMINLRASTTTKNMFFCIFQ